MGQSNAERPIGMAVNLIFDGPPSPEGPRLVEIENDEGRSIRIERIGTWRERPDGMWALRIPLQQPGP